jgi:hypothetical protein
MKTWAGVVAGLAVVALWGASALGQAKPADCPKPGAPETVAGQIVAIDQARAMITLRAGDGSTQQFQAPPETIKDMKVGDRIEAKLRVQPGCK